MAARTTLVPLDPTFPDALLDLPRPPRSLRVEGAWPSVRAALTVVGTREPTAEAVVFTRALAAAAARAGYVVVSGGAVGIDTAAHEGALDVGGTTVVILGGGLDRAYPRGNGGLFARVVASGGALVSEHADDVPPRRAHFLGRNRLLAALGAATVVVQAPARSGALSTATWARKLARPLFAVPGAPWEPRSAGTNALLAAGATICTSEQSVLSVAALERPGRTPDRVEVIEITMILDVSDHEARVVWEALGPTPAHADDVVNATGLTAASVASALVRLGLEGLVGETAGGLYQRVSARAPAPRKG